MARKKPRPSASRHYVLTPCQEYCVDCGKRLWVAYHARRTITTLEGLCELTLVVRRCQTKACPLYHYSYRPEEESLWALPHGEFGLDIIARVGALRYSEHRSLLEIHQQLLARGISIAERTVTYLMQRYARTGRAPSVRSRSFVRTADPTRQGHSGY